MTSSEFISLIQQRGAKIYPKPTEISLTMLNTNLQQLKICMTPNFLMDLYKQTSGITFNSACVFGPTEINRGIKYPLPSILDINKEMIGNKNLYGKLIFGRNDLFWFVTDALGICYMLDNLTLNVLRKYDDPYRAMLDCLIVGKI